MSSALSLIKSAIFFIIFDLSHGEVFFQLSIACFAEFKASSNSFSVDEGIVPRTSSLKGLNTSTLSFVLLDHLPSIKFPKFSYIITFLFKFFVLHIQLEHSHTNFQHSKIRMPPYHLTHLYRYKQEHELQIVHQIYMLLLMLY